MGFETVEGLITINGTLFLQILQFLVLMFILNRLMFQPILKVIKERGGYVETKKAEIEKVKSEVEELKIKFVNLVKDARKEAIKESAEYRETGLTEAEKLLAGSQEKAASIKLSADEAVREKIADAKPELSNEASVLAEEIMKKIIGRRVVA